MHASARASNKAHLISAGTLGCVAGLVLVVSFRRCIQVLGPGEEERAAAVLVFLAGLALGAWGRLIPQQVRQSPFFAPFAVLSTMLVAVIGQRLAPMMSLAAAGISPSRSLIVVDCLICAVVATVLEFLPAFGIGALLKAVGQAEQFAVSCSVRISAQAYALSAAGAIAAVILGYRWVLPHYGTLPAIALALSLLLVFGVAQVLRKNLGHGRCLILSSLGGLLIYFLGTGLGGDYSYGQSIDLFSSRGVEFFRVGATGDVRVRTHRGQRRLEVNGLPLVANDEALLGELALGSIPRLLRPEVRRVIAIGFGSGIVSGASLLFSNTQVVCVESEPAVISAGRLFEDVNFKPQASTAFSVMSMAPRSAVRTEHDAYGLVLVDYPDPRLPLAREFSTVQFYASAKRLLAPDGILAQRVALGSLRSTGLAAMARTMLKAFPHTGLARVSDSEAIWLMSETPLVTSSNLMQSSQALLDETPTLKALLQQSFGTTNAACFLFEHLWLDEEGIQRLAKTDAESDVLTTWRWRRASLLGRPSWDQNEDPQVFNRRILEATRPKVFSRNFVSFGCSKQDAVSFHRVASVFANHDYFKMALETIDQGLEADADQPELLADKLLWSRWWEQAYTDKAVERIGNRSLEAAARVGKGMWANKHYSRAVMIFECLTRLSPQSATLWYELAVSSEAAGNSKRANECFERAVQLDPANNLAGSWVAGESYDMPSTKVLRQNVSRGKD